MKVRNTLIWLFFSLFFMQQASATVASSFHNNEQSNVSTEMSCDHDHHMMHQSDMDGMNCASDMHDKSCCETGCHCNASGCTSSSALLVGSSIQNRLTRSVHSLSPYALVFPDMHASSLFRPPIFS